MGTLRTSESDANYKKLVAEGMLAGGCVLCEAHSLKDFALWKIVSNKYPYDRIATMHHMIVPRRHVRDSDLSDAEKAEYEEIKKDYLHKTYEYMIEATYKKKSVPEHAHVHLVVAKD